MRIPDGDFKVRVGPYDYDVQLSREFHDHNDAWASSNHRACSISISPEQTRTQLEVSLLHEILHACSFVSGINHRWQNKERLPEEEDVVREIATVLYQVIRDNPGIFSDGT